MDTFEFILTARPHTSVVKFLIPWNMIFLFKSKNLCFFFNITSLPCYYVNVSNVRLCDDLTKEESYDVFVTNS